MIGHILPLIHIFVHLIFEMPPTPARSPDLSPLDYLFWSVCLVELRKNPPNSLPELVNTVERYDASLNKDQIITAVNAMLPCKRPSLHRI